jgi:hypothetical protein
MPLRGPVIAAHFARARIRDRGMALPIKAA